MIKSVNMSTAPSVTLEANNYDLVSAEWPYIAHFIITDPKNRTDQNTVDVELNIWRMDACRHLTTLGALSNLPDSQEWNLWEDSPLFSYDPYTYTISNTSWTCVDEVGISWDDNVNRNYTLDDVNKTF